MESEFFYQLTPSLDFALYDIDNDWLKSRQIKAIKFAKPDSRYLSMASIGFSQPGVLEGGEWRKRYSSSKSVSKDERLTINSHKSISYGRVKSYGSITTVINSLGQGSQGSPVFSELGKVWGVVVTSHNDLPDKMLDPTVMSIEPPILPPSISAHGH